MNKLISRIHNAFYKLNHYKSMFLFKYVYGKEFLDLEFFVRTLDTIAVHIISLFNRVNYYVIQ